MIAIRDSVCCCLLGALIFGGACLGGAGCDDSSSAVKERATGPGSSLDGGGLSGGDGSLGEDGGPKDCFDNPTTHFEIINACTNATRIAKNPTLKKLLPDGGLPPLD